MSTCKIEQSCGYFSPECLDEIAGTFVTPDDQINFTQPKEETPDNYIVVINTTRPDSYHVDGESKIISRILRAQYPNDKILIVEGSSNEEIQHVLAQTIDEKIKIDVLFIKTHGDLDVNSQPWIYNGNKMFSIHLLSGLEVSSVFKTLIGHFNDGAKIIFEGCRLYKAANCGGEYKRECIDTARIIARNFGLLSGSIYMNETLASPHLEVFAGEHFWNIDQGLLLFSCQVTLYIVPLIASVVGQGNGFTAKVTPSNTQIYEDDLENVLKGKAPSGDLIADFELKLAE